MTAPEVAVLRPPGALPESVGRVLAELGIEARELPDGSRAPDGTPAVLLLGPGRRPPPGWEETVLRLPPDTSPAALRELLRVGIEAAALRAAARIQAERARRDQVRFGELHRIGTALSWERDLDRLQDLILTTCRELTQADGASLWLVEGEAGDRFVRFASTQNASLDVEYASFTVPLNERSMVGYTIISGRSQLVEDAYRLPPGTPFGWSGADVDLRHGYLTRSMVCVPMRNHDGETVGAIQLVNAKRAAGARLSASNAEAEITTFDPGDLPMLESIASQAAVALDNRQLVESIQDLFEGFVKASVTAIESRDPATYGHSGRVAALTVGLAEAVTAAGTGVYREVGFTADQLREIRYAALLHDFGKVGVREQVLVKGKKLYPEQLGLIRARFAYVQRSLQLQHEREKLHLAMRGEGSDQAFREVDERLAAALVRLRQELEVVTAANEPTVLDEDRGSILEEMLRQTYRDLDGGERPLLEPDEFHFLSIRRGTLDERERLEIESHVTHSFRFLTKIPWTRAMRDVPMIAYGHHEKLDGSGYPRRLTAAAIPLQTRMMTISDIYDALTAGDRPYKPAITADRAISILRMEAAEGKIDADLLGIFTERRVFEAAASYRPDQDLLLGGPGR